MLINKAVQIKSLVKKVDEAVDVNDAADANDAENQPTPEPEIRKISTPIV